LGSGQFYPGEPTSHSHIQPRDRFHIAWKATDSEIYCIHDNLLNFRTEIPASSLCNPKFDLVHWYTKQLLRSYHGLEQLMFPRKKNDDVDTLLLYQAPMSASDVDYEHDIEQVRTWARALGHVGLEEHKDYVNVIELNGQQVEAGTYPALQRNSAKVKDPAWKVPKPLVIVVQVNGHPACALVDSGSLGDFISSTLVEQLKLKKVELTTPVQVQLAVQGSHSCVNFGAVAPFEYQGICEERYFDVINLSNYDLILGTPFLFQHKVTFGVNPPRVVVGSTPSLEMCGDGVTTLASRSMSLYKDNLEKIQEELRQYARPLCKKASETALPPLRAINHQIPLINKSKIYPWRPSRCPEAMCGQWTDKHDSYIKSGCWQVTSSGNTVPMLLIRKPGKEGEAPHLRTVVDLRA
jgi:hypothetical protein